MSVASKRVGGLRGGVFALALSALVRSAAAEFALTEVAPGVYVHRGAVETIDASASRDIANIGFIVGERCVAVIDSGGDPAVGQALRGALSTVTPLPVCYVINTHVHPDHLLGNSAFEDGKVEFVGHARLPAALSARGAYYLTRLSEGRSQPLTEAALVAPGRLVDDRLRLDLGGRTLLLQAHPTAHTDSDLTVFDEGSGTWWLGDLLFQEHLPVVDGSLSGWLQLLDGLRRVPAARVVPGHGPVSLPWPAAAEDELRYLRTIQEGIRAVLARNGTIEEAVETVGYGERPRWQLFDAFHRRNLTASFAELEWE